MRRRRNVVRRACACGGNGGDSRPCSRGCPGSGRPGEHVSHLGGGLLFVPIAFVRFIRSRLVQSRSFDSFALDSSNRVRSIHSLSTRPIAFVRFARMKAYSTHTRGEYDQPDIGRERRAC